MDIFNSFGLIYWINLLFPIVVIASVITATIALIRIASAIRSVARSLEEINQGVKRDDTL